NNRQADERNNSTGRKHIATELSGIPAEGLQHDGEQDRGAVQDNSKREHKERGGSVVAVLEEMQLVDRIFLAQFPENRADKAEGANHRAPHDEVGFKPIVALALIENDLEEAEADAEKTEADVINLEALATVFPGDMRRIDDEGGGEKDGEKTD